MDKKEKWEFIKFCISKRNDVRFINTVMNLNNDFSLVHMVKYGELYSENPIFHIYLEPSYSGFFADHNRMLCYLYYADYYGLKPVVEYSKKYSYAEDYPVNGTDNPFEYYFMQPTDITLSNLYSYKTIIKNRKENTILVGNYKNKESGYSITEEYISLLANMTAKYINLRPEIELYVNRKIETILKGKKTLGIHFRGTDFKQNFSGHPIVLTKEDYIQPIEKLINEKDYENIFLATDDSDALALFKDYFGEKLSYYNDAIRSAGADSVMCSSLSRENHRYQLGLEVLLDMLTLASCNGLVAGLSQVSIAARIQRRSSGKEYEDTIILSRGINQTKY